MARGDGFGRYACVRCFYPLSPAATDACFPLYIHHWGCDFECLVVLALSFLRLLPLVRCRASGSYQPLLPCHACAFSSRLLFYSESPRSLLLVYISPSTLHGWDLIVIPLEDGRKSAGIWRT